ncbi:hypothetical protein Syun_021060 [Stephania yunnanensis]|uniref:Uncharacterized protein n=1 Tax=Stephania yunnanensis TaxID=152371 RepID=A0AAP0NPF9_9MAGN
MKNEKKKEGRKIERERKWETRRGARDHQIAYASIDSSKDGTGEDVKKKKTRCKGFSRGRFSTLGHG